MGDTTGHMCQTEISFIVDGVRQSATHRREPFWYEGLKLEVVVDGQHFELGTASGDGHNCLIDTLRKLLNRRCGFFIPEGSVVDVRNRLEGKHSDLASAITPGDYLELRPYWEDIIDCLEVAGVAGLGIRRGSAGYEVVCVDMTWAGNGDRLPPAVDRNQRKQLYVARVNENHFVPLVVLGDRRFLRPVPPRALHASSSSLLGVPAGGPAEGRSARVPAGGGVAAPAAAFWLISDQLWWLVVLQVYVGFGWACWETGSFLLVFDTIPEDKRTPIMTVYQLALATVMTLGSLLGGGVLEWLGTGMRGYAVLMTLTSAMRLVSLFLLASIEPIATASGEVRTQDLGTPRKAGAATRDARECARR